MAETRRRLQVMKSLRPVTMAVRIFAGEPANHVAINKVESEKGTPKETAASSINQFGLSWRSTRSSKDCNRCGSSVKPLERIAKELRTGSLARSTVAGSEERPEVMEDVEQSRAVGRNGSIARDTPEAPSTATIRKPGTSQPHGAAEDAEEEGPAEAGNDKTIRRVKEGVKMDPDIMKSHRRRRRGTM
jgi:hypothetical protein